jgi:hypothetical protein
MTNTRDAVGRASRQAEVDCLNAKIARMHPAKKGLTNDQR